MWYSARRPLCLPEDEWNELHRQADGAWNAAEWLSYEAGHSFKNRNGVSLQDEPHDMVVLALRRWSQRTPVRNS
jgi:hypothetical protein